MSKFEVLGVNDDKDFCECCGKTGLKRAVFIRNTETDEVKHFGTTCATSPVKGFGVDKEIKAAIKRADDYIKTLNALAFYAYRRAGGKFITNADGMSGRPADPALYSTVRANEAARGFNY